MKSNVLIVHPDLAVAGKLQQLLHSAADVEVGFNDSLHDAFASLHDYTDLHLCICDFHWPDTDVHVFLRTVRNKFPCVRLMVVMNPDIEEVDKPMKGVMVLLQPLKEDHFISVCKETFASLQGSKFSHFKLGEKCRSNRLGDWYEVYDVSLKREAFVSVIHSWAKEEEILQFRMAAALMARATHNHVQAVYSAGEYKGRHFICHEKWAMPSLTEMAASGQKISARLATQILHAVSSVLMFWHTEQYSHVPIGPNDVTVSPQGVVKVSNGVDPLAPLIPLSIGDLVPIADQVQNLISTEKKMPPPLLELFNKVKKSEQVVFSTSMGEVTVQLDRVRAPLTVENFLRYVDRGAYDGSIFHHILPSFVVQGGHYLADMVKIETDLPIPSEADNGLLNLYGTVAMARGKDLNSANSQFLFNMFDNKKLDSTPNHPGYTVFGKVVRGLEVIDEIAHVNTAKYGSHYQMPVNPVVVHSARRVDAISVAEVLNETHALDIQLAPEKEMVLAKPAGKQKTGWLSLLSRQDDKDDGA